MSILDLATMERGSKASSVEDYSSKLDKLEAEYAAKMAKQAPPEVEPVATGYPSYQGLNTASIPKPQHAASMEAYGRGIGQTRAAEAIEQAKDFDPSKTVGAIAKASAQNIGRSVLQTAKGVLKEYERPNEIKVLTPGQEETIKLSGGGGEKVFVQALDKAIGSDWLQVNAKTLEGMNFADKVAMAVPQFGVQIALAMFGGPVASMSFMGTQIIGNQYEELTQAGVDSHTALKYGLLNAAFQAPMEQLGLPVGKVAKFLKSAVGSWMLKRATAMSTEGVTEAVQVLPEVITTYMAKNPGATMADIAKHAVFTMDTAKQMVEEGAVGGVLGLGADVALNSGETSQPGVPEPDVVDDSAVAARELAAVEAANEKGDPVKETAWEKRDAERFRTIQKQGGYQTVGSKVKVSPTEFGILRQAGMSAAQIRKMSAGQLDEAIRLNRPAEDPTKPIQIEPTPFTAPVDDYIEAETNGVNPNQFEEAMKFVTKGKWQKQAAKLREMGMSEKFIDTLRPEGVVDEKVQTRRAKLQEMGISEAGIKALEKAEAPVLAERAEVKPAPKPVKKEVKPVKATPKVEPVVETEKVEEVKPVSKETAPVKPVTDQQKLALRKAGFKVIEISQMKTFDIAEQALAEPKPKPISTEKPTAAQDKTIAVEAVPTPAKTRRRVVVTPSGKKVEPKVNERTKRPPKRKKIVQKLAQTGDPKSKKYVEDVWELTNEQAKRELKKSEGMFQHVESDVEVSPIQERREQIQSMLVLRKAKVDETGRSKHLLSIKRRKAKEEKLIKNTPNAPWVEVMDAIDKKTSMANTMANEAPGNIKGDDLKVSVLPGVLAKAIKDNKIPSQTSIVNMMRNWLVEDSLITQGRGATNTDMAKATRTDAESQVDAMALQAAETAMGGRRIGKKVVEEAPKEDIEAAGSEDVLTEDVAGEFDVDDKTVKKDKKKDRWNEVAKTMNEQLKDTDIYVAEAGAGELDVFKRGNPEAVKTGVPVSEMAATIPELLKATAKKKKVVEVKKPKKEVRIEKDQNANNIYRIVERDGPTYWKPYSVHSTFDEAQAQADKEGFEVVGTVGKPTKPKKVRKETAMLTEAQQEGKDRNEEIAEQEKEKIPEGDTIAQEASAESTTLEVEYDYSDTARNTHSFRIVSPAAHKNASFQVQSEDITAADVLGVAERMASQREADIKKYEKIPEPITDPTTGDVEKAYKQLAVEYQRDLKGGKNILISDIIERSGLSKSQVHEFIRNNDNVRSSGVIDNAVDQNERDAAYEGSIYMSILPKGAKKDRATFEQMEKDGVDAEILAKLKKTDAEQDVVETGPTGPDNDIGMLKGMGNLYIAELLRKRTGLSKDLARQTVRDWKKGKISNKEMQAKLDNTGASTQRIAKTEPVGVMYKDKLYRGWMHAMVRNDIADETGVDIGVVNESAVDGFVTEDGKFVSREEGAAIAKAAKQLDEEPVEGSLDSQDLKGSKTAPQVRKEREEQELDKAIEEKVQEKFGTPVQLTAQKIKGNEDGMWAVRDADGNVVAEINRDQEGTWQDENQKDLGDTKKEALEYLTRREQGKKKFGKPGEKGELSVDLKEVAKGTKENLDTLYKASKFIAGKLQVEVGISQKDEKALAQHIVAHNSNVEAHITRELRAAEEIEKLTRETLGDMNPKQLTEVMVAYENKDVFNALPEKTQKKYQPMVDALTKYFESMKKRLKDITGQDLDFVQRSLEDAKKRFQDLSNQGESVSDEDVDAAYADIELFKQMRFASIPLKIVQHQLHYQAKWGQKKGRKRAKATIKFIDGMSKKRKIKSLKQLLELANEKKFKVSITPTQVVGMYAARAAKDFALADVVAEMDRIGMITKRVKGEKPPTGMSAVSNAKYPALSKYYASKRGIQILDQLVEDEVIVNAYDRFNSNIKLFQFYNPLIMAWNNIIQGAGSGAWFNKRIHKIPKEALHHVNTKSDLFLRLESYGLYSRPIEYAAANVLEDIHKIESKANTYWEKIVERGKRRQEYEKGFTKITKFINSYSMSTMHEMAWGMDRYLRTVTAMGYIAKGHTEMEAAKLAAEFHGDYASVPAGTRRWMNRFLFTPTFKIVMAATGVKMYKDSAIAVAKYSTGKHKDVTMRQKAMLTALVTRMALEGAVHIVLKGMGYDLEDDDWWNFGTRYVNHETKDTLVIPSPFNIGRRLLGKAIKRTKEMDSIGDLGQIWKIIQGDFAVMPKILLEASMNKTWDGSPIHDKFDDFTMASIKVGMYVATRVFAMSQIISDVDFVKDNVLPSNRSKYAQKMRERDDKMGLMFKAVAKLLPVYHGIASDRLVRLSKKLKFMTSNFGAELRTAGTQGRLTPAKRKAWKAEYMKRLLKLRDEIDEEKKRRRKRKNR